MKTRGFVITLFVVVFAFAPQLFRTSTAKADGDGWQIGGVGAGDIVIDSVTPTEAFPGDTVRISWKSSVKLDDVDYFDVLISHDSGAHFRRLERFLYMHSIIELSGRIKKFPPPSEFAWHVPDGFSGHATFQVVAIQARWKERKLAQSVISAKPQVLVRARPEAARNVLPELRVKAEQGDAKSQYELAAAFEFGSKDHAEAVKWYRKAADQNYAPAQCDLFVCYYRGIGVAKDDVEAVKWLRRSAEQNYAKAQSHLGDFYSQGLGVEKDDVEAVKWWRKAAEQNYGKAQFDLGVSYLNGQGVAKDDVEAYKWSLLAAAQGEKEAKKAIRILENQMTQEQIAEGQKLARDFKPRMLFIPRQ